MKLYTSPTSPYGRITRIVVAEKDDPSQCEVVYTDPWDPSAPEADSNPLRKVPILLAESETIVDSRVIAEHLDEAMEGPRLLPEEPKERLHVRVLNAVATGAIDLGVLMVLPIRVDPDARSEKVEQYCRKKILSAIAHLGDRVGQSGFLHGDGLTLADVAAAALTGFLDFRFPDVDWRSVSAPLAKWNEKTSARESVSSTVPGP